MRFIVPEDLGTPAGGISLRGATNFQTPPGWDTVYSPVLNLIERPHVPMLVIRVETDWYPHETEFRYVLQPGEGINCVHNIPIGQVFFVPREEITVRDCNEEEIAAIRRDQGGILPRKSRAEADDRLRTSVQPALSPPEPHAENLNDLPQRSQSAQRTLALQAQRALRDRRYQAIEAATSTMMSSEAEGV